MNKKIFIISLIVFVFAFALRIFFISQKQGFHVDEVLSRVISTGNIKTNINMLIFNNGKPYIGKNLKNFYFGKPQNSYFKDLKELYLNNYNDDAHPSFYYITLRTVINCFDNTIDTYKWVGCCLNLIFFTFSFFIMRKILIRLFGDNKLVPIGLAVAFLNTGAISMTLFIRPYELQMLGIIFISYIFLIYKDKIKQQVSILNKKDVLIVAFSLAFVYCCGYFLVLYVGMLGLLLLWHARKSKNNLSALITAVITSVVLTFILYPGYLNFIFGQRFSNVSLVYNFYGYFYKFVTYLCHLTGFLLYIPVVLLLILGFALQKKDKNYEGISLVICALIWSICAEFMAPMTILRYIAPAFPILSLLVIYMLKNTKLQKSLGVIIIAIYMLTAMFPTKFESSDTEIIYKKSKTPIISKLENIYLQKNYDIDENIPVVISSQYWYTPLNLMSRLNDNQIYSIYYANMTKDLDLKIHPSKHFYLFADKTFRNINIKNAQFKLIDKYPTYNCYEVYVE